MTPATFNTLASGRRSSGLSIALGRHADIALALLLVAIVALFVLPLPAPMLDVLIAGNLAASLVLLIVAMYVPSPLSLSTFPSLLLFTTLFRLSLNIASTKQILLHAHAGQIIDTFGKLVVGNSIVVGGVVFLIIAIVQFIVIAKGSERVAEVAARFALDAMPGKQMSIDAELRAGSLSNAQAQERRHALEQESQLHGAMDGAMKFVKGDAIAGILIAVVNILAGVAIGTMVHGLAIGDSLQRYAVLTVGDGMVSQIPSLLVSIAAGVVITRVTSADVNAPGEAALASQIYGQLAAHPRALLIAALALSSFLLVPGLPVWAFGMWIVTILGLSYATYHARRRGRTPQWISHHQSRPNIDGSDEDAITFPIALRLSSDLRGVLDMQHFDAGMVRVRQRAERDLGPVFPRVQLVFDELDATGSYEILVQDVVVAQGHVEPSTGRGGVDMRLLPRPAIANDAGQITARGNAVMVEDRLVAHLDSVARRHAPQLIGLQEVQRLLNWVESQAPDLAAEVTRTVPLQRIAETLRRLLQEGVPVRNLRAIFESLVRWAPGEDDGVALAELVRVDLGRYISSLFAGADRRLPAVLMEPALLDRIVAAIERSPRGNLLLLPPVVKEALLEQIGAALVDAPQRTAVVVSVDARRYVRGLVEPRWPALPVLSYQELDEDVQLQPVAWIADASVAPAEVAET